MELLNLEELWAKPDLESDDTIVEKINEIIEWINKQE